MLSPTFSSRPLRTPTHPVASPVPCLHGGYSPFPSLHIFGRACFPLAPISSHFLAFPRVSSRFLVCPSPPPSRSRSSGGGSGGRQAGTAASTLRLRLQLSTASPGGGGRGKGLSFCAQPALLLLLCRRTFLGFLGETHTDDPERVGDVRCGKASVLAMRPAVCIVPEVAMYDEAAPTPAETLTGTITWFLRRAAESGLGLPHLMLHVNCTSTVAAMALVAREALSTSDALQARAELYRALAQGAAQCTLAQLAGARYVLACIAAEAPQPGVGAGAGTGTGAVSSGLPAASTSAGAGAGAGAAPLALPVLLLALLTLILQVLRCKLFSPLLQLQQMRLLECTLLQLELRSQAVLVVATGVLLLLGGAAPY
jgi:hypothetical protein